MKSIVKNAFYGACMLLASLCAHGADTDLFAGAAPTGTDAPQLLFVLDTGASFSAANTAFRCNISAIGVVKTDGTGLATDFTSLDKTNGGVEQCALYSVISSLAITTTTVRIGVMMFNSNQQAYNALTGAFSSDCTGSTGGCLVMPIVALNSTSKPLILAWIQGWVTSGSGNYNIKAPANRGDGAVMQESWAYYFGKTGISGRDYASVTPKTNCASKNIIFIGNNYDTQASPKDSSSASPLEALNGTYFVTGARASPAATTKQLTSITDTLPLSCRAGVQTLETSNIKGAYARNWALYLRDQGVITTTIGIVGPSCDAAYDVQLNKIGSAEVGGGKFYSTTDFTSMVNALNNAIGEIQSINSVFSAVSLPVSVNTQGSYLNQVFVGMFRPAEHFFPRWNGNLKQYKIGQSASGGLRLEDADSTAAINGLTGFVTECARSYWTPNTVDTYWTTTPSGGCLTVANSTSSNYPDGNIVEKGAQAYKLRNLVPANRIVKTCSPVFASCTALTDFSTSNAVITQSLLNSGGTDRDALINWARGQNLDDELDKTTSVMRPSSHGDVVHSRPVAINHGTAASPSVVVYYGGNDGFLRAVNGNRGSATIPATGAITSGGTTYNAGDEIWSFMPPEFYGKVKRLRDNTIPISYPTSVVASAQAKDYAIDGPITAFNGSIGGTPKIYLYATMRRGGRVAYAFDVTTPGSPSLLWKLGCPNAADDTGCSTGFTSIGQTWGSLKTMFASGYGATSPLLITGGGYDNCEDYDALVAGGKNHNCTVAATKGNKVFVLDAVTGTVVKSFATDRAVVSDVTVVRDSAGMAKYAYVADMGGNVYRMVFGSAASASWSITKIASLGCDVLSSCTDSTANRKFMFAPSVVTSDNVTYYVLLGSGDREKPVKEYLASKSITNYFFMLMDKPSDNTWLTTEATTCGANLICTSSLLAITSNTTPTDATLAEKKGWYLAFAATEQVVTSAVTVFGVVTFSTHQPAITSANACTTNLGTTQVYNINYLNAASSNGTAQRYEQVSGGGLPPSPDAGQVTLDNGQVVPFVVGSNPTSPLEFSLPKGGGSTAQSKSRIYWYIQK